jgi:hypothetical protein
MAKKVSVKPKKRDENVNAMLTADTLPPAPVPSAATGAYGGPVPKSDKVASGDFIGANIGMKQQVDAAEQAQAYDNLRKNSKKLVGEVSLGPTTVIQRGKVRVKKGKK